MLALITGANQGLGYFASQHLLAGGYRVLVGSRDAQKGRSAVEKLIEETKVPSSDVEALELDVSSDTSISKAAEYVKGKYGHLDVLVNNAGIVGSLSNQTARENLASVFNTNCFGQVQVTEAFLPLLRASKADPPGRRIVFVSSSLSSLAYISDLSNYHSNPNYPAYRASKTALNMLAVYFANLLREEKISVSMVCPGFCATNLNSYQGLDDPRNGAMSIARVVMQGENMDVSGSFTDKKGVIPW